MSCTFYRGGSSPRGLGVPEPVAAAPRGPVSASAIEASAQTKGRASGPAFQVREQCPLSVPLIWRPGPAAPRRARAGMLGDPESLQLPSQVNYAPWSCPSHPVHSFLMKLGLELEGVMGGRKLSENHKLGLREKAFLPSSGILRGRDRHLGSGEDDRVAARAPVFEVRTPGCLHDLQ